MNFNVFQSIACEHRPSIAEDSGEVEWCQGELRALYDDLNGKGTWSNLMIDVEVDKKLRQIEAKIFTILKDVRIIHDVKAIFDKEMI